MSEKEMQDYIATVELWLDFDWSDDITLAEAIDVLRDLLRSAAAQPVNVGDAW